MGLHKLYHSQYFGGIHGHRRQHQGTPGLADITARKSIFALHSAIMKTVDVEARSCCTTLYDKSCHILDSAATETHPGQCSCKCWADDDGSAVPLFECVHHKHHLVTILPNTLLPIQCMQCSQASVQSARSLIGETQEVQKIAGVILWGWPVEDGCIRPDGYTETHHVLNAMKSLYCSERPLPCAPQPEFVMAGLGRYIQEWASTSTRSNMYRPFDFGHDICAHRPQSSAMHRMHSDNSRPKAESSFTLCLVATHTPTAAPQRFHIKFELPCILCASV